MPGAKEDELYVIPWNDADGAGWGQTGIYFRDTVMFDCWRWDVSDALILSRHAARDLIVEHRALVAPDRSQVVGLRRDAKVHSSGRLSDGWTITNTSGDKRSVQVTLVATTRMADLFAGRMSPEAPATALRPERLDPCTLHFSRAAADGVVTHATLRSGEPLADDLAWTIELDPGQSRRIGVEVAIGSSDYQPADWPDLPTYAQWRAGFGSLSASRPAAAQAIDDVRSLLLRTAYGPYPAAGMPIFVNFFGRDALITGLMLLDWQPDMLRSVLRFLSSVQGRKDDPRTEEEPGKILHEIRRGELSRTGQIPFGRYYGSVDSTPLFLIAAGEYLAKAPDPQLEADLRPSIVAATDWLVDHLEGPSGLATFAASGTGLTVQSWKDSPNSMLDEHGQLVPQPLAVAEVQGYAYAALLAAATLLPERGAALCERAEALRSTFHRLYWLDDLQTYAMALDGNMRPLRVQSSDPGHLLWSGIVPEDIAPRLVATLLGPALWSGWGLRTLGSKEVAYNPVSYHNGSVWPHDTGLLAMGLHRYGFTRERDMVAQALLDLAEESPGRQMPEVVSGFAREEHLPPVAYTHANAPQAWSAATVILMASYLAGGGAAR